LNPATCWLLVRETKGQGRVTAANPLDEALTLHVQVRGQAADLGLPGGNFAGSSVTTTVGALNQ